MGVGVPFRAMPATYLALPVALLAAIYATGLYPSDHHGLGATTMASAVLPFVGGLVAACAAWEGARVRTLWWTPIVRRRFIVAARAISPAIFAGAVAIITATLVLLVRSGAAAPDLRVLAIVGLDLITWAVIGYALGTLTPTSIAVPVAVLLPFIWFAFVPAIYPVWLRHMTGMFRDCCRLSEDLSIAAIGASVAANAGLLLFSSICIGARPTLRRSSIAFLALTLSIGAAITLIYSAGLGSSPAVARDPSQLICHIEAGVTLCVWPEHADHIDVFLARTIDVRAKWEEMGIESPALVTEAHRSTAPVDALPILLTSSDADEIVLSLAQGLVPTLPDCTLGSTGAIAKPWLEAWFSAAGGLSTARLTEEFGGSWGLSAGTTLDPLPTVDRLRAASLAVRHAWTIHALTMVATCDEVEQDLSIYP
jgi:hypothetical protein